MSDKDDGLFAFDGGKIVGAFLLEGGITDGKDFVEEENIAFGADSDRKSKANLHTTGEIFEFLVHEVAEFGKINDFIVHGVNFFVAETEQSAIKVDVFATRELWIKANPEFDERDKDTIDFDGAFFGEINLGQGLK